MSDEKESRTPKTNGKIHGWQPSMSFDLENIKLARLKIFSGHNLARKDIFGASDPYARIDLLTRDGTVVDSVYTKTKKKTLNPCWNEEFVFRVLPSDKFLIEVFDENRLTRDDFLGRVELLLDNLEIESSDSTQITRCHNLKPRSQKSKVKGDLEIYLAYIDPSNCQENNLESIRNSAVNENDSYWVLIDNNLSNDSNESLPSGWEECQDTNGRTYYVNHNSRTTQWERPSISGSDSTNRGSLRPSSSAISKSFTQSSSNENDTDSNQHHHHHYSHLNSLLRRFHIGGNHHHHQHQYQYHDDESPASIQNDQQSSSTPTIDLAAEISESTDSVLEQSNESEEPNSMRQQPSTSDIQSSLEQNRSSSIQEDSIINNEQNPHQSSVSVSDSNRTDFSSTNEIPLPSGWTQQLSETGRVFYIDHIHKTTTWIDPRTGKPSPSPKQPRLTSCNGGDNLRENNQSKGSNFDRKTAVDDLGPLPAGWEERVHRDGRIFFINHNLRTTQWEDPRIDIPSISGPPIMYSRNYKKKYEILQQSLTRPNGPNKFEIKVKRNNILEDSFRIISNVSKVDYLKTKLWIEFDSEDVLDYGGPSREWFYLLSKEMFNPYYGLFEYSSTDKYTLQIKPYSGLCNEMHLAYFKFIGRVAGMAIYHGKLLDAFFIRPFYKMMLEKEITLNDMESVDTEYYNSLKYILENDPSELYLNFMIDEKFLDVVEEKELKPNGSQIPVTNANKHEYINLVIDWRFVSRVKPQMNAFLEGFHELIPKNLIKIFDENELELLMCGIGNVDVKDWKNNTIYKGGYHQNHIVIQWFWRVVLSFNNEMRSRLLQFVTGTSRVPMNGFKELYGSNGPQLFTIEKWGKQSNLPRSHTCFNRLDLPCYESYSDLRDKLIKAIEGSETYGGVD
ncbi:hypothetical protein NH340_JMT01383 [Sarcoptes scabiei]|nr:hypothetical protein NH340_JMT01383 [Sarcoptes scabiei]